MTSPRLTSISSASVSVTAWPATARSRSPSKVTTRVDGRLAARDGRTTTRSPGAIEPPAIVPAKPRKSELGPVHPLHRQPERRVLHALLVDLDRLEVLHQRRPAVPRHRVGRVDDVVAAQRRHGDERHVLEAELRGELAGIRPRSRGSAPRSSRRGPSCSPPPRRGGCRAARRGSCGAASASARPCARRRGSRAQSAVDAPVTMLRVYCSWPGVSATMNLRVSVEKNRYATSIVMPCSRSAARPSRSSAKSSSSPCVPRRSSRPRARRAGPRTGAATRTAAGRSACSCRRRRCRT